MKYYKDSLGNIHCVDASNIGLLPKGVVELEQEEIASLEAQALKNRLSLVVCSYLNTVAQGLGYDDIISAAVRAGYPGPYRSEGILLATWMDQCWKIYYELLQSLSREEISCLTEDQIISHLPPQPICASSII